MYTEEYPAPSANAPPTCQIGSGPSRIPVLGLRFGTLPPTAVIQGESSQAAVSGVAERVVALPVGDGQVLHDAAVTGGDQHRDARSPPRSARPRSAR